jgi:hypothetical protein
MDAQKKLWMERTPMPRLGEVDGRNHLMVLVLTRFGCEQLHDGL